MPGRDDEILAAQLALGLLPAGDRRRAQARLDSDAELAGAVADWEARLAPLSGRIAPVAPPPGTLAAIIGAIDAQGADLPGTLTLRRGDLQWVELSEGVSAAVLFKSEKLKRQSLLIRMLPGARYQSHEHEDDEECLVMEGDLVFGELKLSAGDYHLAPKGRTHPPAFSPSGCLLFITAAL